MRIHLFLILIFCYFLFNSCKEKEENPKPSNMFVMGCTVSSNSKQLALNNAGNLVIEQLYTSKSPDTAKVNLPFELLDSYTQILALIYDRKDIPQVDTIIQIKHAQAKQRIQVDLVVEENTQWINQWVQGKSVTGNSQVNKLIKDYKLTITKLNSTYFAITGEKPINGPALLRNFKKIQGVKDGFAAYRVSYIGSHCLIDRIELKIANGKAEVGFVVSHTFSMKCEERYNFEVTSNCEVNYKGIQ